MPTFDVVREVTPPKTYRAEAIRAQYDLTSKKVTERFSGTLPLEEMRPWHVGVIVGPSGSGKTTIARELWPHISEGYSWEAPCFLDDFPKALTPKDITAALNSVGFASPPSWLKPYNVLSQGEQMRANLARALVDDRDPIVFDEFTSTVDRTVAKVGSHAIAKSVRRSGRKFIAVTCHYDVLEWLEPDWYFDMPDMSFHDGGDGPDGRCFRRPTIRLDIHTGKGAAWWPLFRKHHYLSANHASGAKAYVALYDGTPVAFISTIHQPHPSKRASKVRRVHRLVTLPDYQGVGIGSRLLAYVADREFTAGYRFRMISSNPAVGYALDKDRRWRYTGSRMPTRYGTSNKTIKSLRHSVQLRATRTWEWIGP